MEAFNISQIYPSLYTKPLETQLYYIGLINKKNTSIAIKKIQKFSMPQHLKRVKPIKQQQNNQILLCQAKDQERLQEIKKQLGELLVGTKILPVPKDQCYFKQKLVEWEQFWPTSFRNQMEIIKHEDKQIDFIKSLKQKKEHNIHLFSKNMQLLMSIEGECKQNSVLHGVILLLQQWPQTDKFKQQPEVSKDLSEIEQLQEATRDKYYYLTGLRMLIRGQICQMCVMALVHSRLERLYITCDKLQHIKNICYQQSLNHNYHLFKVTD